MSAAQAIAQRFTALCPYCNRLAEVAWQHDPNSPSGKYVWAMHPNDPKQILCLNTLMPWRNPAQEGGGRV